MPIPNTNKYRQATNGMEIWTGKGDRFLIDIEDFEIAKKHCWSKHTKGYARAVTRKNGKLKTIYLHRLLCKTSNEFPHVDHANGDVSDNRKTNLRSCNRNQNLSNQKIRIDNRTGIKGIGLHMSGKYRARLRSGNDTYQFLHSDLEKVAYWLETKRKQIHREFARNE